MYINVSEVVLYLGGLPTNCCSHVSLPTCMLHVIPSRILDLITVIRFRGSRYSPLHFISKHSVYSSVPSDEVTLPH